MTVKKINACSVIWQKMYRLNHFTIHIVLLLFNQRCEAISTMEAVQGFCHFSLNRIIILLPTLSYCKIAPMLLILKKTVLGDCQIKGRSLPLSMCYSGIYKNFGSCGPLLTIIRLSLTDAYRLIYLYTKILHSIIYPLDISPPLAFLISRDTFVLQTENLKKKLLLTPCVPIRIYTLLIYTSNFNSVSNVMK